MSSLPRGWWLAVLAVEFYLALVSLLTWVRMRSDPDTRVRATVNAFLIWSAGSTALGLCFLAFVSDSTGGRAAALGGAICLLLLLMSLVRRANR